MAPAKMPTTAPRSDRWEVRASESAITPSSRTASCNAEPEYDRDSDVGVAADARVGLKATSMSKGVEPGGGGAPGGARGGEARDYARYVATGKLMFRPLKNTKSDMPGVLPA